MTTTETNEPPKATNLLESVTEGRSLRTKLYYVEYGIRRDDNAAVFHFFVPSYTYRGLASGTIKEHFNRSAMDKAISAAAAATFQSRGLTVRGAYSDLVDSYHIEVDSVGAMLDPTPLFSSFLATLDRVASDMG